MAFIFSNSGSSDFSTFPWAPSEHASGLSFTPALTNGDCMMYVVAATDKVASHYIANIDTAGANPGFALRYWQPTDSWFAYCNDAASTGSVTASATGTAANAKVLLGARVSGTALSLSVNGSITTGGTATAFTASRGVINRDNLSNLVGVYDVYTFPLYLESLAKRIEGFLADKYGITLANGHPYRLAAPTQAWNASDDDGLKVWYDFADASTVTITGAGISSLTNKANPATYTLAQATDASRPSWDGSKATSRGGTTALGLNATTTVSWTSAAYLAMALARRSTQPTGHNPLIFETTTGGGTHHAIFNQQDADNWRMRASGAASSSGDINFGSISYATDALVCLNYDGSTTKNGFVNGVLGATNTTATSASTGTNLFLMKNGDGTSLSSFVATSTTTDVNRQRHEGAIAHDKGLTSLLSPSHPYKNRRPIYKEWTPIDDPGLIIWYDFADSSTVTITGAGISSLVNKANPATYTLTCATDADRPSWNGSMATGRGSGIGLSITASIPWTNAAYAVFATSQVTAFNGVGGCMYVVSAESTQLTRYHLTTTDPGNNNMFTRAYTAASNQWISEPSYTPDTTLQLREYIFSGSAVDVYKNGATAGTTGSVSAGVLAAPITGAAFALLSNTATNITLGDFIVSSTTTDAMRQKHEGSRAWAKGLQANLDASHPYKNRPPLTTD